MGIRIIIVDDHMLLRAALRNVLELEPDMEILGEGNNGTEAIRLAKVLKPDVVIMDIRMPIMNGIEATRALVAENRGVKVLALSNYMEKNDISQMLEAGASGYLAKTVSIDELSIAVRAVFQNRKYFSGEASSLMVDIMRDKALARERGHELLGRREREVLQLVADGATSHEIGTKLQIATATVDVHRRNIMRKLGLHTVAELTKYAIREGLISN